MLKVLKVLGVLKGGPLRPRSPDPLDPSIPFYFLHPSRKSTAASFVRRLTPVPSAFMT
jgi:hypothetical protein